MCSLDSRLMSLFVQNHNYLLLNICQFIMSCFEYKRRFCYKLITKLTIIIPIRIYNLYNIITVYELLIFYYYVIILFNIIQSDESICFIAILIEIK